MQITNQGDQLKLTYPNGNEHYIPALAFASWADLLGLNDPVDVLAAILHVAENGEPDPDPETGENAWTAPYIAIAHQEQAAAQAAITAKQTQTDDPRSPKLRAALATLPLQSEVEQAQAQARAALGIPDPTPVAARTTSRGTPQIAAATRSMLAQTLPETPAE